MTSGPVHARELVAAGFLAPPRALIPAAETADRPRSTRNMGRVLSARGKVDLRVWVRWGPVCGGGRRRGDGEGVSALTKDCRSCLKEGLRERRDHHLRRTEIVCVSHHGARACVQTCLEGRMWEGGLMRVGLLSRALADGRTESCGVRLRMPC